MNESKTFISDEESEIKGVQFTISMLYLCSVDELDAGMYSCLANNSAGNTSAEFEIQANPGMSWSHFVINFKPTAVVQSVSHHVVRH